MKGLGNRYSQHSFAQIPQVNMARSSFDRSFTIKDTFDFDYLIPVFVDEILPGDTINLNLQSFGRLATPKFPVMDNMYIDYFFFFVPNRLLWTNWEVFISDSDFENPNYLIPTLPTTAVTGEAVGTIYDKMGIPTEIPDLDINALPFRAYNLIWNEWFRAQELQSSIPVPTDDGPDAPSDFTLLKRGKRHDYFTSCLLAPQRGSAVQMPLGSIAPVERVDNSVAWQAYVGGSQTAANNDNLETMTISGTAGRLASPTYTVAGLSFDPRGGLQADLSSATAATINQLRQAFSVQSILELDARGGTRYVELLLAHFNVVSPDFRLQRPEYLGGGQSIINVHPVAQTSPTSGSNPQGQLAAFGTVSSRGNSIGFTKSFVEHGYVIGLACARADITYQQGLNKLWSRQTRFDFFWPKLQEIGEQAVTRKEIYAQGTSNDDIVFGYQERYAEYRYKPSEIHGAFRSTYATSLDAWHMAEEFSSAPSLNSDFIVQNTPVDRAIVINTEPHIILDLWFNYKHARPMMAYSVPSSLGRF